MDIKEESLKKHYEWHGKIKIESVAEIKNRNDLALAYTPGVAEPCLVIAKDPEKDFELTRRFNTVAVVTDGSAVLGLGNIGPRAAMPVMEGKCLLFKNFADIDAFPICISSQEVDDVVKTVKLISTNFGGINLEDISAPRCFEIEKKLKEELDIPVFHDDQHGTAVVATAALNNALRIVKKDINDITVVINGAGAAGTAIAELFLKSGVGDIIVCDSKGILNENTAKTEEKLRLLKETNKNGVKGTLKDAISTADVFLGVSKPRLVTSEMVKSMKKDPIIFALANPEPEILPEEAIKGGAKVIGTGRSDLPNQINNVLAFPGIFKGAMACRAREISDGMQLAAARAIAELVDDSKLSKDFILPDPFDPRLSKTVAKAVSDEAKLEGLQGI